MWPDRVSNPGPLTCESGALPTALRGPAKIKTVSKTNISIGQVKIEWEFRCYYWNEFYIHF